MEAAAIRQAISLRPFQPFRLRLADGRELMITHPETVAVSPNGRRVVTFAPDDSMAILEPLLIVSLEYAASAPGAASGNGPTE